MHARCQVRIEPKYTIIKAAAIMVFECLLYHNTNILLACFKHLKTSVIYKISILECMRRHMYNYSLVWISTNFSHNRWRVKSSVPAMNSAMRSGVASMSTWPLGSQYGHLFHLYGLCGSWWPWLWRRVPSHTLHFILRYSLSNGMLYLFNIKYFYFPVWSAFAFAFPLTKR